MNLRRRLRLRRSDGSIYLERWGVAHERIGGLLLHRMDSPDPGQDLHDHPWTFVSLVLIGGYYEDRDEIRSAPSLTTTRRWRRPWSIATTRLDECHHIVALTRRTVWALVLIGPVRRRWGFYTPHGYVDEKTYDERRREMWNEIG